MKFIDGMKIYKWLTSYLNQNLFFYSKYVTRWKTVPEKWMLNLYIYQEITILIKVKKKKKRYLILDTKFRT